MDNNPNGGKWLIKPAKLEKPKGKRRTNKTVDIKELILRETLKKRSIARPVKYVDAITGQIKEEGRVEKKENILHAFDQVMEMVLDTDYKVSSVGIKLFIELLKVTDIVYHPSVIARIDLNRLIDDPAELEQFTALLQKANQKYNKIGSQE